MKNQILLFLILLCCSSSLVFSINLKKSNEKKSNSKIDEESKDAYSFGLGSDGGNRLLNPDVYVAPEFVDDLTKQNLHKYDKEEAVADEKESIKHYYDGELNLNQYRLICSNYITPKNCHSISHCGWCGSSNSCIEGTKAGPVEKCKDKKTFTYNYGIE